MQNIFYRLSKLVGLMFVVVVIWIGLATAWERGFIKNADKSAAPIKQEVVQFSTVSGGENQSTEIQYFSLSENYHDERYEFDISYPKGSKIIESEEGIRIDLPFTQGTTLSEKYLKITVREKIAPEECSNPAQTIIKKVETVRVRDMEFKKEIGRETAAGNLYESVSYSIMKQDKCFGFTFILRHADAGVYPSPPKKFDREKETEIFERIISTFH